MEFIETKKFADLLYTYLDESAYLDLQISLIQHPESGNLIKGGGGIRKLRFRTQGKGKSGGVRIIYYWLTEREQIYMLYLYSKSKKDTLTDAEVAELCHLVKEIQYGHTYI